MNKHTVTTLTAFAAACLAGSSAFAGTMTRASKQTKEVMQESCITGDIGFEVTSEYIRHGVLLENQGFILQPYADLHFRLWKGPGPNDSITADIGIWNSFHDHHPLAATNSTLPNWFEFDFLAGLTFNAGKLAISPYFRTYESPSSVFDTAYTSGIKLCFDDKDMMGSFSLHPYALFELQLQGTTGNNFSSVPGSTFHGRGQYYEVGVAPGFSWGGLTLSIPIKGGFGSGGFYLGNRGFGFVSGGLDLEYALTHMPSCLGKWTIHGGAAYYYLNGNNDSIGNRSGSAGSAPAALPGTGLADNHQIVFSGGLKVAF